MTCLAIHSKEKKHVVDSGASLHIMGWIMKCLKFTLVVNSDTPLHGKTLRTRITTTTKNSSKSKRHSDDVHNSTLFRYFVPTMAAAQRSAITNQRQDSNRQQWSLFTQDGINPIFLQKRRGQHESRTKVWTLRSPTELWNPNSQCLTFIFGCTWLNILCQRHRWDGCAWA